MRSQDEHQPSRELEGNVVPRSWEGFQRFAADVERAEREGVLANCRELVGGDVVEQILAAHEIDADIRHLDPKRRCAALYVAMFFREVTEGTLDGCLLLAESDRDKDVRVLAIELLGRFEGSLAARTVPFLLGLILAGHEDEEIRLRAYRSLVYVTGGVSKVRVSAVLAHSLADIDWEYVASCKAGCAGAADRGCPATPPA
jgi:hypothetical protein